MKTKALVGGKEVETSLVSGEDLGVAEQKLEDSSELYHEWESTL